MVLESGEGGGLGEFQGVAGDVAALTIFIAPGEAPSLFITGGVRPSVNGDFAAVVGDAVFAFGSHSLLLGGRKIRKLE